MTKAVNAHPLYVQTKPLWDKCSDAYKGEDHIKAQGERYLPPTVAMELDGMKNAKDKGSIAYNAYKMRAQYPDYVQVAVETIVGILNAKEMEITLPDGMEYLLEKASNKKEGLQALIRRIHEQQISTGRVGLLVDMPTIVQTPAAPQPYIALYDAMSIINWDDSDDNDGANKLTLVVLDESAYERSAGAMTWQTKDKYRTLVLNGDVYQQGESEESDAMPVEMITPQVRGQALKDIPFVFINSKDNLSEPDVPPLLGLVNLCLSIYRSEADYRQALFMQGQDTLVVIGGTSSLPGEDSLRVGAGARIDVSLGGDAKYVGVDGTGLSEQRTALENDRKGAAVRTGQLLAPGKMSMESGEALKTRVAAQTATLTSLAKSSASALETVLKIIATWTGKDASKVKCIPNLDFTNIEIQGQDIVQLITAKTLGFPLSFETLHNIARERGLTKNTFLEEMELINKDPKVLIERAIEMAGSVKGNNPLEGAGGPKKSPANDKTGASNAQK